MLKQLNLLGEVKKYHGGSVRNRFLKEKKGRNERLFCTHGGNFTFWRGGGRERGKFTVPLPRGKGGKFWFL